ncbi:type VI secretion system transmembrane protein TssO [Pedobacter hartonius]|uniref:Uncharacterized protein n=1 Tax=Pedobacter hartonius TaxID=425514 RepID=A0A1H4H823_9SPHI|nr:type VI secretion system transmembrane protein TssO [Pedobacter hartonius]SEB17885.1 hypothetical protein SAMN05443550_11431 [Pedobacter hartonius]
MNKLSVKERREQFIFLLGIFLLTIGLLGYGLFHDFDDAQSVSKEELTEQLSQDAEFEALVNEQRATIDSTYKHIMEFDPGVQADFLENDIRNSLGSIQSNYNRRAFDLRYKTFLQTAQLYNDLFYNRRELKGNLSDLEKLNKSLEDCKLSTRQLRETLGSQTR